MQTHKLEYQEFLPDDDLLQREENKKNEKEILSQTLPKKQGFTSTGGKYCTT